LAIRVFVDANIFKYSATRLRRLRPRSQTINWGEKEFETTVHDIVYVNPNLRIANNDNLRREVDLIPEIVALQDKESIEFCITTEAFLEIMGLPDMDSMTGRLFGAKITRINAPIKYSRVLIGSNIDAKKAQYDFLRGIKSKRFIEIQKATGAYQGKNPPNKNQLLDAFHLWCAEHSGCDVFLSGEAIKLRNLMKRKKNFCYKTQLMIPSELLARLDGRLYKKIFRKFIRWLSQTAHKFR